MREMQEQPGSGTARYGGMAAAKFCQPQDEFTGEMRNDQRYTEASIMKQYNQPINRQTRLGTRP
jgi:hypothetical protein